MSQPIKTTFTIAKTGSINSIKMRLKIEEAVDKINGKPSSLLFLIASFTTRVFRLFILDFCLFYLLSLWFQILLNKFYVNSWAWGFQNWACIKYYIISITHMPELIIHKTL